MGKNWFLIISLLFISCGNNPTKKSVELIPMQSFKDILIDIQNDTTIVVGEIDMINNVNHDSLFLIKVLNQHNYSYERYERTLSFYIDQPKVFIEILTSIKDSLAL